jgi:pSer/pThr/pTyr-binding forkhead associated (FHA) protein/antitoxin (DNA-binding transcriptional repressor) of toxin-antitoxin stability system
MKILITKGPNEGQSFDLNADSVTIGRSHENDIQINDLSVSRNHAKITRKGNTYVIRDLGSKNSTVVAGKKLHPEEEYEIGEGSSVSIGGIMISLVRSASESEMAVTESIDISKELSDDDLAILDSIDISKEVDEHTMPDADFTDSSGQINDQVESFAQDRPMTAQKNMELVYEVSSALMQSLHINRDINEILENILQHILNLLKRVDRGVFILIDNETGKVARLIPILKRSADDTIKVYSRTIVDRVIREGKAVTMLDTKQENQANLSESMKIMKVRSVMCVPLISRSKIRGVIYVDSVTAPHGFRKEDLSLLTALSIPAAYAIENSLIHEGSKILNKAIS